MTISTVDAAGQALQIRLFDADKSQSKAKVVVTETLDSLCKK
jgi:hypothetical protein